MDDHEFNEAIALLARQDEDAGTIRQTIEKLANASRISPEYRERLAARENLEALLSVLQSALDKAEEEPATKPLAPTRCPLLAPAALRCIGNACIDNDAARQIVTESSSSGATKHWAIRCLSFQSLWPDAEMSIFEFHALVVKVLYNVCSDFEPAQKGLYSEGIATSMLQYYGEHYTNLDAIVVFTAHFFELLLWLSSHRQPNDGVAVWSDALAALYNMPRNTYVAGADAEDFAVAVEIALTYLRDPAVQERLIKSRAVHQLWHMLEENEEYISKAKSGGSEEDVRLLVPFSTSLTWCLSDIAANPNFASHYAKDGDGEFLHGEVVEAIVDFAAAGMCPEGSRLASAACQVLGNLLWSVGDALSISDSIKRRLQDQCSTLTEIGITVTDRETLHSVAGVLVQLCRALPVARDRLSANGRLSPLLDLLCANESKEIRQDGMKLLQLLGKHDAGIREQYAGLAKRVTESLVAEQDARTAPLPNNAIEAPA